MCTSIVISFIALIVSGYSFYMTFKLTGDNNIIAYTTAILTCLDKVNKLEQEEQTLFIKVLRYYDFFGPTTFVKWASRPFKKVPADIDLEKYFYSKLNKSN